MTDDEREKIKKIAEDRFMKSERVKMLQMSNTPQDFDKAKEAAVEYALAMAELREAEQVYEKAIGRA